MRASLLVLLAAATSCGGAATTPTAVEHAESPATAAAPGAGTPEPGTAPVAFDPAVATPEQYVTLLAFDAVAFAAEGEPVEIRSRAGSFPFAPASSQPFVAQRGDRMAILSEQAGARLLLWVDRDDVALVPTTRVDLAFTRDALAGDRAAREVGITIDAGTSITVGERDGDAVEVSSDRGALRFRGWLPAGSVGRVYRPSPPATPGDEHEDAYVESDALLRDAPGGGPIAELVGRGLLHGVTVLRRQGGHALVAYAGDGLVARGWVAEDELTAAASGLLGGIGGALDRSFTVPAGTCLFAEAGGASVGHALEEVTLGGTLPEGTGWHLAGLPSAWGELPVWIELGPDGFAGCR